MHILKDLIISNILFFRLSSIHYGINSVFIYESRFCVCTYSASTIWWNKMNAKLIQEEEWVLIYSGLIRWFRWIITWGQTSQERFYTVQTLQPLLFCTDKDYLDLLYWVVPHTGKIHKLWNYNKITHWGFDRLDFPLFKVKIASTTSLPLHFYGKYNSILIMCVATMVRVILLTCTCCELV